MIQDTPCRTGTETLGVVKQVAVRTNPFSFWALHENNRCSHGIYKLAQALFFTGKALEIVGAFFCAFQGDFTNLVFHDYSPRLFEPVIVKIQKIEVLLFGTGPHNTPPAPTIKNPTKRASRNG
jgi:hypothetical protein